MGHVRLTISNKTKLRNVYNKINTYLCFYLTFCCYHRVSFPLRSAALAAPLCLSLKLIPNLKPRLLQYLVSAEKLDISANHFSY